MLHKKTIIKKTLEVGGSTLLSRVLGLIRDLLMQTYLGKGILSDAFLSAYKIPNSLRKIFGEGALSAAFIPTLVKIFRQDGQEQANSLMSVAFLIFEGILLFICALFMWRADIVISWVVPGFGAESQQLAIGFLHILMPFILFISSSALLTGALQAVHHFWVPALSQVFINIVCIGGLLLGLFFKLPVEWYCWCFLLAGAVQFVLHLVTYFKLNWAFGPLTRQAFWQFMHVMIKFVLCAISMSIVEFNFFIDSSFASYLPAGNITLLYYANRFMGIPLGAFGVAFSTILLPHFSRISTYAPNRLNFYLLEATKLVYWVVIPVAFFMSYFSDKIFSAVFIFNAFSSAQINLAASILIAYLFGLFFFCLNKVLLNMYYALRVTWIPSAISVVSTSLNVVLNYVLMPLWGAPGLALATAIAGIIQTILLLIFLIIRFEFKMYPAAFFLFLYRYTVQLVVMFSLMLATYYILRFMMSYLPAYIADFFLNNVGLWIWVGPLFIIFIAALYFTRSLFKVRLYFFD